MLEKSPQVVSTSPRRQGADGADGFWVGTFQRYMESPRSTRRTGSHRRKTWDRFLRGGVCTRALSWSRYLKRYCKSIQASVWPPDPSKHSNTKIKVQDKHGIASSPDMAPRPSLRAWSPVTSFWKSHQSQGRAGSGEVVRTRGRNVLKEARPSACGNRKCFNCPLKVSQGIF